MRTVKEVLAEMSELKKNEKTVSDIVDKMRNDREVAKYMREQFGVSPEQLGAVATCLSLTEMRIRQKLEKCEVDV